MLFKLIKYRFCIYLDARYEGKTFVLRLGSDVILPSADLLAIFDYLLLFKMKECKNYETFYFILFYL